MRFASFLSGGFITAIVVNPPESKLAKRTSVQWFTKHHFQTNEHKALQNYTSTKCTDAEVI